MASGIVTPQEIVEKFNEMKLKKKVTYMLIGIHDSKELRILKEQPKGDTYDFESFSEDVQSHKEGCYAILDHEPASEPTKNKLIFIAWVPDTAKVKSKMLLASTKNEFQKKLVGLAGHMNITGKEDLDRKGVDSYVLSLTSSH